MPQAVIEFSLSVVLEPKHNPMLSGIFFFIRIAYVSRGVSSHEVWKGVRRENTHSNGIEAPRFSNGTLQLVGVHALVYFTSLDWSTSSNAGNSA